MKKTWLQRQEKSWQTRDGGFNVKVATYHSAEFRHNYNGYGKRSRNTTLYTATRTVVKSPLLYTLNKVADVTKLLFNMNYIYFIKKQTFVASCLNH